MLCACTPRSPPSAGQTRVCQCGSGSFEVPYLIGVFVTSLYAAVVGVFLVFYLVYQAMHCVVGPSSQYCAAGGLLHEQSVVQTLYLSRRLQATHTRGSKSDGSHDQPSGFFFSS